MLDGPITDEEVFAAIRKLKMGKAPGVDGMLTSIIKTAADAVYTSKLKKGNTVVEALTLLFNYVFEKEKWPERWVVASFFLCSSKIIGSSRGTIDQLHFCQSLVSSLGVSSNADCRIGRR